VVLLDELNKYAPREGQSPIKETLVDIAQRGRSLGIILIGAQQTASRVAPEVVENASIRVTGRLDAAEAERSEYGWMLPSTRAPGQHGREEVRNENRARRGKGCGLLPGTRPSPWLASRPGRDRL
jgi:hypothetical protein